MRHDDGKGEGAALPRKGNEPATNPNPLLIPTGRLAPGPGIRPDDTAMSGHPASHSQTASGSYLADDYIQATRPTALAAG